MTSRLTIQGAIRPHQNNIEPVVRCWVEEYRRAMAAAAITEKRKADLDRALALRNLYA